MRQAAARHLAGVAAQSQRQGFGYGLAGEVVFRGAQPAHQHHDVRPAHRGADGPDQVLATVADDGLEMDGDAQLVQLLSQMEGVGVLAKRGQHLGTDGNDFRFHKGSFQLLASSF
jgi:hypothetical protein